VSDLTYGQAVVLGVVQGLTEFLPVSSSAHLAVAQNRLRLDPAATPMHVVDGVVHVATVLAMLIVFAGPFRRFLVRLFAEISEPFENARPLRKDAWRSVGLTVVASVPTALIGLFFKDAFERSFGDSVNVGLGLVITGGMLVMTALLKRGRRGFRRFHWKHALFVGIAQGIAISPGISRSGATICMASFFGLRRRWAAEFSFLIAMPAILGATLLKFREAWQSSGGAGLGLAPGPLLAAFIASLVVGVISLRLLLSAVRRAKLHYFAWYCWLVGGLLFAGIL